MAMPIDYEAAISAASEGKKLKLIAEAAGCHVDTLFEHVANVPSFAGRFARARDVGLEKLADDLIDMASDESLDVQRLKLHADNLKWLLARRKRKEYGDRVDIELTEKVDVSLAITEARRRILRPVSDLDQIEDAQFVELPTLPSTSAPDETSVASAPPVENPFDD